MLTTIAGALGSIAAIFIGILWIIKSLQKSPAETDADIDKQIQDEKSKSEQSGRPV